MILNVIDTSCGGWNTNKSLMGKKIQKEFIGQGVDNEGFIDNVVDDYNENILVIDLKTFELINKIELKKDDSRALNTRIFLPY